MNLVVGATGSVGLEVCRLLRRAGKPVRAFVRRSADEAKTRELLGLGVELAFGDLKTPATLDPACRDVVTVLSTASSTLSRQEGDSIESVDLRGHLHLVQAARAAGARHLVFVSFARQPLDFPLQTAKRAVENEIVSSGVSYTILQPVYFMETWLGSAMAFDPPKGTARVLGDGNAKVNWVSRDDVARFAAGTVDNVKVQRKVLALGGPEALSEREVLRIFREAGGPETRVEYVSERDLEAQMNAAADPLSRSFGALMLTVARGQVVDSRAALDLIPLDLLTVRRFAERSLASPSQ